MREGVKPETIPAQGSQRTILGVPIQISSRTKEVERLDSAFEGGVHVNLAFANSHTLGLAKRRPDYRRALEGFHVLNDGIGVDIASRIKFGERFPENLNGTDFVPYYLASSRHDLRIYLLGARPEVVEAAAGNLRKEHPRHRIVGHHNGYFKTEDAHLICGEIRRCEPDVVLVAMGNPLQEFWIEEHGARTGAKLLFGVGALFDFKSGLTPRAPALVRRLRCEWVFRLVREPRRLWRRYIFGNAVFLKDVIFDRAPGGDGKPLTSSAAEPRS